MCLVGGFVVAYCVYVYCGVFCFGQQKENKTVASVIV